MKSAAPLKLNQGGGLAVRELLSIVPDGFEPTGEVVHTDMRWWTQIRIQVLREGASKRQILRETSIHWSTLQKILEYPEPPGYRQSKPRAPSPS